MKQRHVKGAREHARATLDWCRIPVGTDFHTLSVAQKDRLEKSADQARYRKPASANGSRLRYFHDLLQRQASLKVQP